jgi:Protein of unknown function (DUF3567)
MQMLYNSENFAVVQIDVQPQSASSAESAHQGDAGTPGRGGYEIVDKFARKEIFLQGALAESFKRGVDALIRSGPSDEEIDAYIGRFSSLMQHPLTLH